MESTDEALHPKKTEFSMEDLPMGTSLKNAWAPGSWAERLSAGKLGAAAILALLMAVGARADEAGGEANLKLPDLSSVTFLGLDGHKLLLFGIVICVFGLLFGLAIYSRLKNLPVHQSMKDISELISRPARPIW